MSKTQYGFTEGEGIVELENRLAQITYRGRRIKKASSTSYFNTGITRTNHHDRLEYVSYGKVKTASSDISDVIPGGVLPQCGSKGKEGDEQNVAQGNS